MNENRENTSKKPTIRLLDALIVLIFAFYSLLFFLGKWDGSKPFIDLSSDMALNVAGSAAALDHPQTLAGDPILGNPDNFDFYLSIHIPLTRILARWLGDYGQAVIFPLGLHVFLQLCGFYILGRAVFQNRFWAFLLAAMSAITVTLNLGEYWGVYSDPQPRFTFQAILPFLLAAAYHWRERYQIWPLVMIGMGCLVYVHSVSAPLWAFALWLGFWLYLPKTWRVPKRLAFMFMSGMAFVLVMLPFMWNFLGGRDFVPIMDMERTEQIIISQFQEYFRPWLVYSHILAILTSDGLLWPGLVGLGVLVWIKRNELRSVALVILWIIGIIVVSVGIPTVEAAILNGRSATFITLIWVRGLRYIVPFLMLFTLWLLSELTKRIDDPSRAPWKWKWMNRVKDGLAVEPIRITLGVIGIFFVLAANVISDEGYQSGRSLQWRMPGRALACWAAGHVVCPISEGEASQIDILHFIDKELPEGSSVQPIIIGGDKQYSLELAVRYAALHPVPFTDKDFSTYAQANPAALAQWDSTAQVIKQIQATEDHHQRAKMTWEIGKRLKTDYLLLDWQLPEGFTSNDSLLYKNEHYSIYTLKSPEP